MRGTCVRPHATIQVEGGVFAQILPGRMLAVPSAPPLSLRFFGDHVSFEHSDSFDLCFHDVAGV